MKEGSRTLKGKEINGYAIIAFDSSFYIFGGQGTSTTKTIAAFSTVTKEWKVCGKLKNYRSSHGVIVSDGGFLVVGGLSNQETERCTLDGDSVECTLIEPKLDYYAGYPEMMPVPNDYCQK